MSAQTKLETKTKPQCSDQSGSELRCLDIINQASVREPGIVGVDLNVERQQVSFDYDPDLVEEPTLRQIARNITPPLRHNLQHCTLRLGSRDGRSCESCALALEGKVGHIPGVRQASASYLGGVLSIAYDHTQISPDQLLQHIKQLGVSIAPSSAELLQRDKVLEMEPAAVRRAWAWLTRQNVKAIFTAITFVAMMLGWITEYFGAPTSISAGSYVIAYIAGGIFGLKGGLESLRDGTIDIDLLMIMAALGAAVVGAPFEGAMLLFLFSLSNVLQEYALDRTRNAIRALMKLRPEQALIRRGSRLVTLPIDKIVVGDRFLVRPGDRIPLDGVVAEGESTVDQASITGESIPVAKSPGDAVLAGTINQNGSLEARVTKPAKDSTIAKMIRLVEEAQSRKAHTQRFLDRAEQYYAAGVIGLTVLAIIIPTLIFDEEFGAAFYRAMALMVAASPCALIISTPASILSAIGNGARQGILFKGGMFMEQAAGIKVVAFDKTGTLTEGEPKVTDIVVLAQSDDAQILSVADSLWHGDENDFLALAAAIEAKSEHALAQATVEAAQSRNLELSDALAFEAETGMGARGIVDGLDIRIGNERYFEKFKCVNLEAASRTARRLHAEGKTSVFVGQIVGNPDTAYILGVIAFADRVRPEAASVVHELKTLGVERVVMLTGDNQRVAQAIAAEVGVDDFYADLLPEDKVHLTRSLEAQFGSVAMVGDGVNDAPALASASIGIAMGAAGSDVALETADVVLLANNLRNIPYVIELSRKTRQTLITNLGFALAAIIIMVMAIFTVSLPLPLAVIGHEGGTVLVSLNGLRLLVYRQRSRSAIN